jgi:ABC-2 type transport system ATP-binding protein
MISVQNLSKTYPSNFRKLKQFFRLPTKEPVEALRNVSFEVADGEIFGLIGKNGAGKTTLTKIIATLVQPTSGTVSVNGIDSVKNEVKVRSLIGLATAEERSFYWRLTCEQNLMFFARLCGLSDKNSRKRIAELFEQLGLIELRKRRFSDLSTGNKQRLAIARSLITKPSCLLLDEPTRSLDPVAAAKLRELISNLKNVSILLTSHNLAEVEELCGRVAVIVNGEVRIIGKPEELHTQHKQNQQVTINFELNKKFESLSFTRESEDYILSEKVNELLLKGAKIIDVETKNSTLLDVLESYETKSC